MKHFINIESPESMWEVTDRGDGFVYLSMYDDIDMKNQTRLTPDEFSDLCALIRTVDAKTSTLWSNLLAFIKMKNIGDSFTRQQMREELRVNRSDRTSTLDNYRNYLTRAGYLSKVSRGKYRVANFPRIDNTVREIYEEAY